MVARGDDHARPRVGRRKGVVPPRHTAGDLQVDDAVAHPIASHGLAQHGAERGARHGHGDAQFAERAHQPIHVAPLVDEPGVPHFADFIDAVGELIPAILDVDRRLTQREIAAVDIGAARHG